MSEEKIDADCGPGITCAKHGIYGREWPFYEKCPHCESEDKIRKEVADQYESLRSCLLLHEKAILEIRKALTGDIHSTSDLVAEIEVLKQKVRMMTSGDESHDTEA